MLDFDKYKCYNLPHVTTCPVSPTCLSVKRDHNLVAVKPALKKDLSEDADVAGIQ